MALQDLTPQLRTRLRRVEKIVGLFVIVAALVLVAGFAYYLYHTAERKGWFIPKCPYYTYVASGEGLKVGDPVVLMGFNVGEITVITAQPPGSYYKVYVGFVVRRPYYGYIWSDSKARIAPAGFLGSRQLEVTAGTNGAPTVYERGDRIDEVLIDGNRVPFAQARNGIFLEPIENPSVTERAQALLTVVEKALPNVLGLTNQVDSVLANSAALTSNANQLVSETRPAVSNLTARLDATLIAADTNLVAVAGSLNDTLLNLASITSNLNAQVQSNDQILSSISKLVIDADNLVQGVKKFWLLRGIFEKMNSQTNTPASNGSLKSRAEGKK